MASGFESCSCSCSRIGATEKREQTEGRMVFGSFRSIDEFLASFAYKSASGGAGTTIRSPTTPPPPPPPPPPRQRQKKKEKKSFQPSSYLRTTIGGKTVVVSKYFPLPPAASPPVVIDKREIERALAAKNRMFRKRKVLLVGEARPNWRRRMTKNMEAAEEEPKVLNDQNINSNNNNNAADNDKDCLKNKRQKKKMEKQRSVLSVKEKKLDAYKRVSDNNTWEAPPSCYNLLQERHSFDPWRVLIICMLLNLTSGKQVKRVLPGLFLRCPNAEAATKVPEEELVEVLRSLGLHRKRARAIKNFSCEYLGSEWTHVTQLPGVGKYAADAYAIFCVGKPEEVMPEDHKLVDYWKFVCEKRDQEQQQQQQQQHCAGESAAVESAGTVC